MKPPVEVSCMKEIAVAWALSGSAVEGRVLTAKSKVDQCFLLAAFI